MLEILFGALEWLPDVLLEAVFEAGFEVLAKWLYSTPPCRPPPIDGSEFLYFPLAPVGDSEASLGKSHLIGS